MRKVQVVGIYQLVSMAPHISCVGSRKYVVYQASRAAPRGILFGPENPSSEAPLGLELEAWH
jgi:hypothetical protein